MESAKVTAGPGTCYDLSIAALYNSTILFYKYVFIRIFLFYFLVGYVYTNKLIQSLLYIKWWAVV